MSLHSNPSSPPTPYKNGAVSLHSYTINEILKLPIHRKVDLYATIISIGSPMLESTKYGDAYFISICLQDSTNIIWIKLKKTLIDQYQNELLLGNQVLLRSVIVIEEEAQNSLIDDIWTSVCCPETISISYFTL